METLSIVALKVMERRIIERQKMWKQILNEIKIQTYLNHPNIVRLFGFFEEKGKVIQRINPRFIWYSNTPRESSIRF